MIRNLIVNAADAEVPGESVVQLVSQFHVFSVNIKNIYLGGPVMNEVEKSYWIKSKRFNSLSCTPAVESVPPSAICDPLDEFDDGSVGRFV